MKGRFTHFVGIDWSGAKGQYHRGIAVAQIGAGEAAPALVRPKGAGESHIWSRAQVLDWICQETPADTLIGFDMGQSLAHADAGAFFPGWVQSPTDARALWAMVDAICADEPHLGVSAFVDHPVIAQYFRRQGRPVGAYFGAGNAVGGQGRWRVAEHEQRRIGCRPASNFNLVGAAQVGKASLAGMRLLHRLPRDIAVWPIDPVPPRGRVVVEIYSAIAAMAGGRSAGASKIRDGAALDAALAQLGAGAAGLAGAIADHQSDALITAAWLRRNAHRAQLWQPPAMTTSVAQTEGWTFGVA